MANIVAGDNPLNLDLATQQAELDRKRQLMSALLMQSMQQQPTQMAGNIAVRQGPLHALARVLTGVVANKDMGDLAQQERELVNATEQKQADAMQGLMGATQAQPGTPTTINEEAGPPDAQGNPSISVHPGTPGGMDATKFGKAYAQATRAGVNPQVLAAMLQNFQRNQLLSRFAPQFVPGMDQGAPTTTPGDATHGASISMPTPSGGGVMPSGSNADGLYGVPGMAAGLTISGDPALEKLGTMISDRTKPQNLREGGSLVQYDANGNPTIALTAPKLPEGTRVENGQIVPIPGYMGTKSEILTKEAAIKAGFNPVTMENSDGTKTQGYLAPGGVFRPFAMAPVSAGPAGAAPAAATPAPALNAFGQRPGEPANDAAMNAQGVTTISGPGSAVPSAGTVANRSQSTQAKSEAEGVGTNLAKQQEAVDEGARTATAGLARTQEMRATLDAFNPNAAAPMRQKLGEIAQAAGLSDDTVRKIAGGDLAAMQVFVKHSFGNSTELIRTALGPGQRITQMEMAQQYKNSANPSLTRQAITAMLDFQEGGYRWMQDKQQMKDAWVQQNGSYAGFEGWWNRNHPLNGPDLTGKPYIPTPDQMRTALSAKTQNVRQGVDTATGVPQPQASGKTVMRFDAQGNLIP